jgi:hypothetical protein
MSNGGLGEGRRRTQYEVGSFDGFRDGRRDHREPGLTAARPIDHRYRAALITMRLDLGGISPPEPDFVTGQRKIAASRERTVASSQHCDLQDCPPLQIRYAD